MDESNHRKAEIAETFFEDLWRRGDPWQFETSDYDQSSYDKQAALISDRRYRRVLEIGCGAGSFTRRLVPLAEHVLAIDISPAAISTARDARIGPDIVEFRVANVMQIDDLAAEEPWDLIVLGETIYYLGWLYSFFEVWFLARRLFNATSTSGRLIMTNTLGAPKHYLQEEGLIRTYRDLFVNAGYVIEREQFHDGRKNDADLRAVITLFSAPVSANAR